MSSSFTKALKKSNISKYKISFLYLLLFFVPLQNLPFRNELLLSESFPSLLISGKLYPGGAVHVCSLLSPSSLHEFIFSYCSLLDQKPWVYCGVERNEFSAQNLQNLLEEIEHLVVLVQGKGQGRKNIKKSLENEQLKRKMKWGAHHLITALFIDYLLIDWYSSFLEPFHSPEKQNKERTRTKILYALSLLKDSSLFPFYDQCVKQAFSFAN